MREKVRHQTGIEERRGGGEEGGREAMKEEGRHQRAYQGVTCKETCAN